MALPQDRSIPFEKFPDSVQRFVGPTAPPPMKLMLARGLVPMKPLVQLCALYQLAATETGDVQQTAVATARKVPRATVVGIAKQPLLPVVLDWVAQIWADAPDVLQAVLLNQQTDIDTLVWTAEKADEETTELLARNQQRLLESSALVRALYLNRNTRASTADRIIDFAARNDLDLSDIPGYREILAAVRGLDLEHRSPEEEAAIDAAFRATQQAARAIDGGDDADADADSDENIERLVAQAVKTAAAAERADAPPEAPERSKSVAGMIRDMNIAQKVRLAMMGGKTERGILIRDSNKLVARSAIRSPAVNAAEAILYAKDKGMLDEVIAYIARNKRWLRHYQMKIALVNNPKTPTGEAINLLTFLRSQDLRIVAKSRNVPGPIAKAAKQLLHKRSN